MATQSARFYQNEDGSTADLIYDDVAMTSSGVQIHVPLGAKTVIVNAVVAGQPVSLIYPAGTDVFYPFGTPLPFTFGTSRTGAQTLDMPWFGQFSAAVDGG